MTPPEQTSLDQQFAFLKEIDQLKSVVRKSPLLNQSRRENSAEHSWHLAMYALVLQDSAPAGVDINRVIKMLLLHDIVEIDAGDHPIHANVDTAAIAAAEQAAAERIFALLPTPQGESLKALWQEFEAAQSVDARFAKALDRLQPMVHNLETNGGTWNEFNVGFERINERYLPIIQSGSEGLGQYLLARLKRFFNKSDA